MSKIKTVLHAALFGVGLALGVFLGFREAVASSPEGRTSGGEPAASVQYDEHWVASQAVISSPGAGYATFNPSSRATSPPASQAQKVGSRWRVHFPKMVVTQWRVHGHIHFE